MIKSAAKFFVLVILLCSCGLIKSMAPSRHTNDRSRGFVMVDKDVRSPDYDENGDFDRSLPPEQAGVPRYRGMVFEYIEDDALRHAERMNQSFTAFETREDDDDSCARLVGACCGLTGVLVFLKLFRR